MFNSNHYLQRKKRQPLWGGHASKHLILIIVVLTFAHLRIRHPGGPRKVKQRQPRHENILVLLPTYSTVPHTLSFFTSIDILMICVFSSFSWRSLLLEWIKCCDDNQTTWTWDARRIFFIHDCFHKGLFLFAHSRIYKNSASLLLNANSTNEPIKKESDFHENWLARHVVHHIWKTNRFWRIFSDGYDWFFQLFCFWFESTWFWDEHKFAMTLRYT